MQVTMVDPSLFTPQYDGPLVAALTRRHHAVLIGRPERRDQVSAGVSVIGMFYRTSERLRRTPMRPVAVLVKPVEHVVGWVRLLRTLRGERADVLHVQWAVVPIVDAVAMRLARRWSRVVITVHNTTPLHGGGRRLQRLGTLRAIRAAEAVIVHTEHSKQTLVAEGVPRDVIHVIPHGPLGFAEASGASTRRPDDDVLRLLQFGKLRPYKGLDVTLSALEQLTPSERSKVRLTVAGDPMMDVAALRAQADRLDDGSMVAWELGFVDDDRTRELLDGHDVMVLPYRDVDGSGVLALAQNHGLVVLASRVGGFTELLSGSAAAALFDVDDHHELARCIRDLIDPATRASRLARASEEADALPTWDLAAEMHEQVYESLPVRPRSSK